jgi:hypothetical protein
MHPHLQGNERKILLQMYWNYYMSSQNGFYGPIMQIESPEKPQKLKNSNTDHCSVSHGRNLSAYLHPNHEQYAHNLDAMDNGISQMLLCIPGDPFLRKNYFLN